MTWKQKRIIVKHVQKIVFSSRSVPQIMKYHQINNNTVRNPPPSHALCYTGNIPHPPPPPHPAPAQTYQIKKSDSRQTFTSATKFKPSLEIADKQCLIKMLIEEWKHINKNKLKFLTETTISYCKLQAKWKHITDKTVGS